jgi:putative membrane protein
VAFAAEYSSIHNGFPFGIYYYVEETRNQELWVAGVPLMDSLSWSFLTFTGYTCAWQLVAAWKSRNGRLDDAAYQAIRRSPAILFLGALITVWMDPIIDTVALMGDRWFLGQIHGWPNGGEYFGVPLTNFAGWYLVTAVTIGVNQAIDTLWSRSSEPDYRLRIPYIHLGGFALFIFLVGFNLFMTAWLREWTLFLAGLPFVVSFLLIAWRILAGGSFAAPYPAESAYPQGSTTLPLNA